MAHDATGTLTLDVGEQSDRCIDMCKIVLRKSSQRQWLTFPFRPWFAKPLAPTRTDPNNGRSRIRTATAMPLSLVPVVMASAPPIIQPRNKASPMSPCSTKGGWEAVTSNRNGAAAQATPLLCTPSVLSLLATRSGRLSWLSLSILEYCSTAPIPFGSFWNQLCMRGGGANSLSSDRL